MKLYSALLVVAAISALSCAKKDSIPPKYRNTIRFRIPIDIEKTLKEWKVECEDKSKCPSSVGQITIRKFNSDLEVCTGFLISNDTVMTNSHCIPEHVQCERDVTIHFPESGNLKAERAQCERSYNRSLQSSNPLDSDYIYLKIKGTLARDTLKKDITSGVQNNEELQIIKFDPQLKSEVKGILRVQKVKVVYESFQTPASNSPKSSIHSLVGATVIPGNSGSPIVSSDFKTVKLIAQAILDKRLEALPDTIEILLKDSPSIIYATNMTCVGGPSEHCDDVSQKNLDRMQMDEGAWKARSSDDLQQIDKVLSQRSDSKVFIFSPDVVPIPIKKQDKWVETLAYHILPKCFKESKGWIDDFKKGNAYLESAKVILPNLVFKKRARIDENGKLEFKIHEESTTKGKSSEAIFSASQVNAKGESNVTFMGQTMLLKICGK